MAKIGIEWVKDYSEAGNENLKNTQSQAEGFYNNLSGVREFNWGDNLAWDQDFEESGKDWPTAGTDVQWGDAVDIVFFSGHGNRDGFYFGRQKKDNGVARCPEIKWGNGRLKWSVLDACEVLKHRMKGSLFAKGIDGALEGDGPFAGKAYFFKGDYYLRYDWSQDAVDYGYPRLIADNWSGWPSSFGGGIDDAICGDGPFAGKAYFFKGSEYFRYDWNADRVDPGYPKPIAGNWHGFPASFASGIDAALLGAGRFAGKAYFFKGSEYIRYDWNADRVDPSYPKPIAGNWHGMPAGFTGSFDACLCGSGNFAGRAYFFKRTDYVRYDWESDSAHTGYPKSIAAHWHDWPDAWDDVHSRWDGAFAGLHYILGFHSLSTDESNRGRYFADYLNEHKLVRVAWKHACQETEDGDAIWAYLRAEQDNIGTDTGNDHWIGKGTVSTDPGTPTTWVYATGRC